MTGNSASCSDTLILIMAPAHARAACQLPREVLLPCLARRTLGKLFRTQRLGGRECCCFRVILAEFAEDTDVSGEKGQECCRNPPDPLPTHSRPAPDPLPTRSRPTPDPLPTRSRPAPDPLPTRSRPPDRHLPPANMLSCKFWDCFWTFHSLAPLFGHFLRVCDCLCAETQHFEHLQTLKAEGHVTEKLAKVRARQQARETTASLYMLSPKLHLGMS